MPSAWLFWVSPLRNQNKLESSSGGGVPFPLRDIVPECNGIVIMGNPIPLVCNCDFARTQKAIEKVNYGSIRAISLLHRTLGYMPVQLGIRGDDETCFNKQALHGPLHGTCRELSCIHRKPSSASSRSEGLFHPHKQFAQSIP